MPRFIRIPAGRCPRQRYIDIGSSDNGRVLVIVYTERGQNIHIISCRKAAIS
ncbi:MAG: hypothetical protein B6D35_13295 [Candidatus Brocadia sp. UTAMX2]|nr:MAG: hypothetical protein B6D35_13295 [Candidatus Brocadia sp. UTAMX2]